MKRILLAAAFLFTAVFAAEAQNTMVVNTETIFKSITAYTQAMETLDAEAQSYQNAIDNAYAELEAEYNQYQSQRSYLSEAGRQQREDAIIAREREIAEYQQNVFGQEGDLMQRRVELIKPIQDRVFAAINSYAQSNNFDLVIDIASNPSVLYYSASADRTQQVIAALR